MTAPDPLRAAALEQLERMRPACEGEPDGVSVHDAVAHCMNHTIMPPPWLCSVFLARRALVRDAHVDSWDKAYGKPFPKGARLAQIRLDGQRRARVHAEMWAEVRGGASIGYALYERIGELPGINTSPATVKRRYREAVKAGAMDLAIWRDAQPAIFPKKVDP